MATFSNLFLYDKSTKNQSTSRVPFSNITDSVLASRVYVFNLSWFSRVRGLHCFLEVCGIINFEQMATDSQRQALCMLLKNGSLSHKLRCYTGISCPKKSRNITSEKVSHFFTCVVIANYLLTRHSPLALLGQVDELTAKPSRF